MPVRRPCFDARRGMFELGLARQRIDHGIDDRADARLGGGLAVPVDRDEQLLWRDRIGDAGARGATAPAGGDAC